MTQGPQAPQGRSDASDDPARPVESALARDLAVLRGDAVGPRSGARAGRRGRRLAFWLGMALALAGAAALAWRGLAKPPEVSIATVAWRDFGAPDVVLSASGYLEAHRQITVSSKAQGKIVEMAVAENQQVAAGDLIARLESDEARAQLALARAEFADAGRELARLEKLRERGAASEVDLDRARTQRDVARARLDLAQVAYANREIRAPIDGTVIRKIRDEGEFLTIGVSAEGDPGTAVVTLADLSSLEVALEVGETEIGKVALGATALVTPEATPRRRYLADVVEIAAMADRQKGVVPVTVRIREPEPGLLPDMSAKVAFLAGEPAGPIEVRPAVPTSAVVERDGRPVVFTVAEERVTAVAVEVQDAGDGYSALVSGPEEGSAVVEAPPPGLRDGDPVRLRQP